MIFRLVQNLFLILALVLTAALETEIVATVTAILGTQRDYYDYDDDQSNDYGNCNSNRPEGKSLVLDYLTLSSD